MSETFRCDDKERLVEYLYGEIDDGSRREVERHLRTCAACVDEVESLKAVRNELVAWQPPDADLGFTIVAKSATVLRPSRWSVGSMSRWTQAAAAVLMLAAGAAIANVQVRYTSDGVTVSTGWMMPAASQAATTAPAAVPAADALPGVDSANPAMQVTPAAGESWRPALVALEQSLRDEMAQMQRASRVMPAGSGDTALLQRVEAMLQDSERRQQDVLAQRIFQLTRDMERRRSADLMRISQGFTTLQGRTLAGQQELANFVRFVNSQQQPQQ